MHKFSVLISIYVKERPVYFDKCLQSLFNQTLRPSEIIIVKDGPITDDLENVLFEWSKKLPLVTISLEKNMGLGIALNEGLMKCKYELIARMDSDDIADPQRFERQMDYFYNNPSIDILGGQIVEFKNTPCDIIGYRNVPIDDSDIKKYMKSRNPFNHMTVMFKKRSVLEAGGYKPMLFFEDYYLWSRMAYCNAQMHNLEEVLVYARVGNDMIGRRTGLLYAKQEIRFFKKILSLNLISKGNYLKVVVMRVPFRLLPKRLLSKIYKLLHKG